MLEDLTTSLWAIAGDAWATVGSTDRRTYWPFILVSVVIGLLYVWAQSRSLRTAVQKIREAFGVRVWLHRSALMDLRIIALNSVLRILLFPLIAISAWALMTTVVSLLTSAFGEPAPTTWPRWTIAVAYTVTTFVAFDFSRYFLHMIAHEVSFVWEFHKIHHSAQVLTPLSVARSHPVEIYLFAARGAIVSGLVAGVFFYLFRGAAIQYELVGVNVVALAFNAIGSNLRHTSLWLRYPRLVEYVFMSPAQHQIHHGDKRAEYKANYGAFLSVFDWMFGSLYLSSDHPEPVIYGLTAADNNHDPTKVWSAVVGPFVAVASRLKGNKRSDAQPAAYVKAE